MFVLLCDEWRPVPGKDDKLAGFETREEAEFWKADADRVCAGEHFIIEVIPDKELN
jgi:hypothetical protein